MVTETGKDPLNGWLWFWGGPLDGYLLIDGKQGYEPCWWWRSSIEPHDNCLTLSDVTVLADGSLETTTAHGYTCRYRVDNGILRHVPNSEERAW
ncbi:MAG TPA: hypothetical protein VJQ57_09355 [Acidimicrobiia bacterium]|nr:hypothetical protein [Acidimicrobiia bacterium]